MIFIFSRTNRYLYFLKKYLWLFEASLVAQTATGDLGSILWLGRSPGGWHGNPLQYSCVENPHGQRSLADYSPWGLKESDMTEQLSTAGKKYHIIFWYKLKKHKDENMGARGIFHSSKLIFYIKTEILLKK